MSGWLRWYEGTCGDAKFQIIARNVTNNVTVTNNASVTVAVTLGVWAALLEDASNGEHRGMALRPISYHASILNLSDDLVSAIVHQMELMEMVQVHENKIKIINWNKLQYETDTKDNTNTERQRRWRERKRQRRYANGDVTATNGNERPDSDSDSDLRALRSARSFASALPSGALSREPDTKPAESKQGMSPDPGNDYRSPPRTKSDNVLEPLPDKIAAKHKGES